MKDVTLKYICDFGLDLGLCNNRFDYFYSAIKFTVFKPFVFLLFFFLNLIVLIFSSFEVVSTIFAIFVFFYLNSIGFFDIWLILFNS